ncbi:MAG: YabP/YqfC family sporulation protein [Bacillota bacterium]|nr:YabP/YqfC family sporulation protein [Bacillota bacterium]
MKDSSKKDLKKTKRRAPIMSEILDMSPDIFGRLPQIEMTGNREITVEGHHGVVEYENSVIKLSCGKMLMVIFGENLVIKNFNDEYLTASGFITRIEFLD